MKKTPHNKREREQNGRALFVSYATVGAPRIDNNGVGGGGDDSGGGGGGESDRGGVER